ncbi:ParB/RepB/Spo0J family partition protein [Streptomyces goshikiensis]|uniref:ParB/RepB/Spo0J family partition protein n=1 Tax=Streptomyces goshikiensis TaxID=1942 RepID=UPI003408BDD1
MTATVEEIATTVPTADSSPMELIWIDPNAIEAARNIRPVDLDPEFIGSIRERGVLEPVTVVGDETAGYSLVFGFHRHAASIAAGRERIPAIVRSDISTNAAKVIEQLTENIHRSEMRPSDIAAAYDQLALEGLDVDEIARQVSQDKAKVKASLRLHKMPKAARDAADAGQLDLEQSMALAEFENDSKVYARLLKVVASGGHLKYALESERRRKKNREEKAQGKARLVLAGVVIIPKPGWESVSVRVNGILAEDGAEYTEETHARCPGHAAYLTEEGAAEYVCREPKKYGHQVRGYYKHLSEAEQAAQDAAKQAEADRKEALSVAAQVRRDWVAELARASKAPKGLYKATVTHLFTFGLTENVSRAQQADVFALLGASPAKDVPLSEAMRRRVDRTPEHKLPLVLFAQLAVLAEDNMKNADYRFRFDLDFAIAWLELLVAYGYPLTDPETQMITELRERREKRDNPAPEPEDDWDDEDKENEDDEAEDGQVTAEDPEEAVTPDEPVAADADDAEPETAPVEDDQDGEGHHEHGSEAGDDLSLAA